MNTTLMVDPGRVRALLVDDERVHASLTERLGDLDRFAEAMLRAFPELG